MINSVFEDRDAAVLCPYDVSGLDETRIADAHRTHPVLATNGSRWDSASYTNPLTVAADFNLDLPDPPADAVWLVLDGRPLAAVRRSVGEFATAAGLSPQRIADLTLAANELVSNTMAHAGGQGTLYLWLEDGLVVCQVVDGGHIADPLAGRRPPPVPLAAGGRGLLLVNQVCDLVRVHTRPGATTIRVHVCL
jgi:anti-sigma regulatory factor (Ser/Thr protein kinase)